MAMSEGSLSCGIGKFNGSEFKVWKVLVESVFET